MTDQYENMSDAELREELRRRQLDTDGERTVLLSRLRDSDVQGGATQAQSD